MTDRRLRMLEDKHLRDSARALVEADVEHIKADFANKGMAKRALFRLRENAGELYDEALDVADSNKGAVAAVFAALIVWFARNPSRTMNAPNRRTKPRNISRRRSVGSMNTNSGGNIHGRSRRKQCHADQRRQQAHR